MILLNPGPVTLSERVRQALLQPDICHRESEFSELQAAVRNGLLAVYDLDPAQWAAVPLTGSGTAAVEAMLSSLVPRDGRLLVIENGVYGERISAIARRYGIAVDVAHHDWTDAIEPGRVAAALARERYSHLAAVHHETTTGRLNDLSSIAELCRRHDVRMLVDAVSSFGAEILDFDHWPLAACAATANKCLHGIPGVSFAIVARAALSAAPDAAGSLYLDLASYCRQQDQGGTPFTQSIPAFYALSAALDELADEGGRAARRRRYQRRMKRVREGLAELAVDPLLPAEECSVVLQAFHLPRGIAYPRLHDELKAAGFVIYAGQGELARQLFRISTMGAVEMADIERLLEACAAVIRPR